MEPENINKNKKTTKKECWNHNQKTVLCYHIVYLTRQQKIGDRGKVKGREKLLNTSSVRK